MKRKIVVDSDSDADEDVKGEGEEEEEEDEEDVAIRRSSRQRVNKFAPSGPSKSLKKSGLALLDEIQDEDEDEVAFFKEETDAERQRRLNFVVDDDGTGYLDEDLDHDGKEYQQSEGEDSEVNQAEDGQKKKKKKKSQKLGDVDARAEAQKTTIMEMFAKSERRRKSRPEDEEENNAVADIQAKDAEMAVDDSLADLLVSASSAKMHKKQTAHSTVARPSRPAVVPKRTSVPLAKPSSSAAQSSRIPATSNKVKSVAQPDSDAMTSSYDYEEVDVGGYEPMSTTTDLAKGEEKVEELPPAAAAQPAVAPVTVPSSRSKLMALASAAPAPMVVVKPKEVVADKEVTSSLDNRSNLVSTGASSLHFTLANTSDAPPAILQQTFPFVEVADKPGKEMIELYWMDMWENRSCHGDVYVFGRTMCGDVSASALVILENVQRNLLVLPRGDGASDEDGKRAVQEEALNAIRARLDPAKREHVRFRSKWVSRSYAFELPDIPRGKADYLMIQYSMALETRDSIGEAFPPGRTFSHIFGANQSAIERLILSNKLMGPCWLQIESSEIRKEKSGKTHGKFEATLNLETPGTVLTIVQKPPPRVSVLSLALKTVVDPTSHQHQIVAATGILHQDVPLDASKPPTSKDASIAFQLVRPVGSDTLPAGFSAANPQVMCQPNERALLSCLLAKLHIIDPDFLMGHNIEGFELDLLLTRTKHFKIAQWSKLGRLNLREHPAAKKVAGGRSSHFGVLTPGRLLLDTYKSAQEFVLNQREYSLSSLCDSLGLTLPNQRRVDVDPGTVPEYFKSRDNLAILLRHNVETAQLALELAFKLEAFSLTFELTTIAGNLWRRTLGSGRAERIEYLLLHAFHNLDYVVPDKEDAFTSAERKRKAAGSGKKVGYSGGLVLDPKVGLYDSFVVLLDFNALYPSIIQEYNICFTTVQRPAIRDDDDTDKGGKKKVKSGGGGGDEDMDVAGEDEDDGNNNNGDGEDGAGDGEPADDDDEVPLPIDDGRGPNGLAVLPRVIKNIVDRRVQVKNQLSTESDPMKKRQLDTRQKALKITANSMYGCLGFSSSRFFAKPLASLITSRGRLILQDTVETTKQLGYEVAYGDTDSIMIDTRLRAENPSALVSKDLEPIHKIAEEIQKAVNPKYKYLKIALDGIFGTLLLLKKKKYAALTLSLNSNTGAVISKRETKGLDLVRRDWCLASRDVGSQVLDLILSGKSKEEVIESIRAVLVQFKDDARALEKIGLDKWTVTKGLNKSPRDYPDAKGQPHLQVALAMMTKGKVVNTGDHIPYVICTKTRAELKAAAAEENISASSSQGDPEGITGIAQLQEKKSGTSSFAERAFHPDEVREQGLLVDVDWYLVTQILPPVQRLCEVIEGISSAELAEALGLDSTKFKGNHSLSMSNAISSSFDEVFGNSFAADLERFKSCDKVELECPTCSFKFAFPGLFWLPEERKKVLELTEDDDSLVLLPGTHCPKGCAEACVDTEALANMLVLASRRAIKRYHQGWLECSDDPTCADLKTRQQGLRNLFPYQGKRVVLHRKYSSKDLWIQLLYFTSLVDTKRYDVSLAKENEHRIKSGLPSFVASPSKVDWSWIKEYVENMFLRHSGYGWVTPDFFSKVFKTNKVAAT